MPEPVCSCEKWGDPLCGFCKDDLFCPQCGSVVTSVSFENTRQDDQKIWIYPKRTTGEFLFHLSLACRDAAREHQVTFPELDLTQSRVCVGRWFEPDLEELEPKQKSRPYRLKPHRDILETMPEAIWDHWYNILPLGGVEVQVNVCGGFGRKTFTLHICQTPEFTIRFKGQGVKSEAAGENTWRVDVQDVLNLDVEIEASTAPVFLTGPIGLSTNPPFTARLNPSAPPETSLLPPDPIQGQKRIWTTRLTIDTTGWNPDEEKVLTFAFSAEAAGETEVKHTFRFVPGPFLEYSMKDGVDIAELYYGEEVRSGTPRLDELYVTNIGRVPTMVGPPQLILVEALPVDIPTEVAWSKSTSDLKTVVKPREMLKIDLRIDLSKVPSGALARRELRWSLVLTDGEQEWFIPIVIRSVVEPPLCTGRLAIDFGSTNTYAAVWNDDVNAKPADRVIRVLKRLGHDPEMFQTVMYFRSLKNRQQPDFLIGPDAAALGCSHPRALVKGLKQKIGLRNKNGEFPLEYVRDDAGREVTFAVPELVKLFFRRLIEKCEEALRQRIDKIGFSFPTDFSRDRIRGYEQILDELAQDLAQQVPPRRLNYLPPDLDEASAVALDYVLNPEMLQQEIGAILSKKKEEERRQLVVASIDVGGGTVDIALIRVYFDKDEQVENADLRSEYLGFGGDRDFGGEIVTAVVFDLLVQQLQAVLQEAGTETATAPLKLPLAVPGQQATDVARGNYDSLWNVAELLKLQLCGDNSANRQSWDEHFRMFVLPGLKGWGPGAGDLNLFQDPVIKRHLEVAFAEKKFDFQLDKHIYVHELWKGDVKYIVADRLKACIDQLEDFANAHGVEIDVVVLAGAGARLPLVGQLLKERGAKEWKEQQATVKENVAEECGKPLAAASEQHLGGTETKSIQAAVGLMMSVPALLPHAPETGVPPSPVPDAVTPKDKPAPLHDAVIHKEMDRPKSMVAFGLVRYHEMKEEHPDTVSALRCSVHYTQKQIGYILKHKFHTVVNRCSPIDDESKWYDFPVPLQVVWRSSRERFVYLKEQDHTERVPFGHFDLNQPAPQTAAGDTAAASPCEPTLPATVSRENRVAVRFRGGLDKMELKVEIGGKCYGYWPLQRGTEE